MPSQINGRGWNPAPTTFHYHISSKIFVVDDALSVPKKVASSVEEIARWKDWKRKPFNEFPLCDRNFRGPRRKFASRKKVYRPTPKIGGKGVDVLKHFFIMHFSAIHEP